MCAQIRATAVVALATPLGKHPELVREDVLYGYVSVDGAREDCGVVIDPQTPDMDREKTKV